MSFLGIDFGKVFTPRGTGGATANSKRAEALLKQSQASLQPARDMFSGYVAGRGSTAGLPSQFQVPDWAKTQGDVYNAYSTLGDRTAADIFQRNNTALAEKNLRSGNLYGSSGGNTSFADLLDWYDTEKARSRAEALTQSLQAGQNLRGEGKADWWNALQFLGDTTGATQYGNVGNQFANIGANQTNFLGNLLKTGTGLAGANPQWFKW